MKRMLCIVSSMDRGGAETFLMKIYRTLDKDKYQMDFCVSKEQPGFYDEEIVKMGGMIFHVTPKSKNPFKSFYDIYKVVKEQKYKSVLRTSQQSLAAIDLIAARLGGAKKVIYRSSNANITGGTIKKILNRLFGFLPRIVPNVKIAPSTDAAEFVFGKRQLKKKMVTILPNGLDYNKFEFNNEVRQKIRKELNLENKLIFGHIGRFDIQKNHTFLIDVFNEIHQTESNSVLILIGEGILKNEIQQKVKKLHLEDSVLLLAPKSNINEYMMAMDLLIFPSFFEGMPNVVIESQATGLRCLISDSITKEARITDLVIYESIKSPPSVWADMALKNVIYERKSYKKQFELKGYILDKNIDNYIEKLF